MGARSIVISTCLASTFSLPLFDYAFAQDEKNLLRIEGAIKMLQYMSLSGPDDSAKRLDSLTDLLTSLGQLIQQSNLSPPEKESGQRILNRIVLNFFERKIDIDDDWAELEEI
jgi:hypothetical protein